MKEKMVLPFYIKLAFVIIILTVLTYVAVIAQKLIIPLCFSFLFSILLLPFCNFLENRLRFPRTLASVLASVLFIFSLVYVLYLLGAQLASFSKDWPLLKTQLAGLMATMQTWVADTFHIDAKKETAFISNTKDSLLHLNGAFVGQTLLSISSLILFVVFVLIYTVFILCYRRLLVKVVVATFTDTHAVLINEILEEVKQIIKGYIVGLFLEMIIVFVFALVIFLILGIKYVIVLAIIVGVFNLIPYVGIFSALVFSVCVTFATSDAKHALFVGISIICIHLLDSNFVGPKIVGSHVNVNPFLIILGVVVGEMIWGIPGMFISIPLLAIGKVIFDKVEGLKPLGILLGEEEPVIKKNDC